MKKPITILILLLFSSAAFSQFPTVSISSDVGIQRSFKKEQQYWAFGHTTHVHFHLAPRDGVYVSFGYYSNGKFSNRITATAKSPLTIPQAISYTNNGSMRLKQFSVGWRKYLKGTFEEEQDWGLYGYAGFGLLLGRIINTHSTPVDTVDYEVPVLSGKANFKRLTLDLGLGAEVPLSGDLYFYMEARAWVPTTDYPSKYIFVNDNAPVTAMLIGGIRLLF